MPFFYLIVTLLLVVSLGLLGAVTGRSHTTAPIDTAIGALLGVVGSLAVFWWFVTA